jgi:uncharacterized protein (TIGR03437 family)
VDQNVPGKFDLSDGIPADVPSFAMPLTPGYFLGPNLSTPNASTALVADPALTSFEYAAAAPTATGPAAIDPRRFIGSATKNVRISTVDFSAHTCTFGPLPRELKASSIIPGTPLTVSVTFDPTGVAVGQHNATLSVTCPGTANSPLTYPISYTVDAPAPFIFPGGVVNGADYVSDEVAPGSLVNVYFDGDPSTDPLTLGTFDSAGKLSTTVDGKQVLWQALTSAGGTQLIASPIIYTAPNVVSTLAPFAIGNGTVTALQVVSGSAKTPFYNLPVAPRAPGFLTGGSGSGQAAVLNQDNSFNAVTPAEQKEILTFFAVGAGTTTPPSVDGATVNGPYPTPNGQVSLDFLIPGPNGAPTRVPAPISYAGAAPGLVSGVLQVNAAVPPNVPSGANVVVLTVGANSSPAVATVQVK